MFQIDFVEGSEERKNNEKTPELLNFTSCGLLYKKYNKNHKHCRHQLEVSYESKKSGFSLSDIDSTQKFSFRT